MIDDSSVRPLIAIEPEFLLSTKVAIVGNAAGLTDSGYGTEIDSFEDVIRFNGAITEGFEADVGSRTTVQLVGVDLGYLFNKKYRMPVTEADEQERRRHENAARMLSYFPDSRFVTFDPRDKKRNSQNPQYKSADYFRAAEPERPLWYFEEDGPGSAMVYYRANEDLEKLGLVTRLSHGGPRTGMKIVLRCALSGLRPTLYGFDIDTSLEFATHYHDTITKAKIEDYKPHDIRGEMRVLKELHEKGFVTIRGVEGDDLTPEERAKRAEV